MLPEQNHDKQPFMTDTHADMTSEELAPLLLDAALTHIPFDGWTAKAINQAADDIGITPMRAHLVFPSGAKDLMDAHLTRERDYLQTALAGASLEPLRIRDRIKTSLLLWLKREATYREASRRAASFLAMPPHAPMAARHVWAMADIMWRAAGDAATDFNHYSKRAIVSGIITATHLYWLNDMSDDYSATEGFIERRIDNVMQFEKVKAKARQLDAYRPSLARFLGRLRYPEH